MSKVLVDRELLERAMYANDGKELIAANRELRAILAYPAEAEWVEVVAYATPNEDGDWQMLFFDEKEAMLYVDEEPPAPLVLQSAHLAALSAVTAERDAALAENARLIEDRARFPDKPDDIGNMIGAHIGNLKAGKEQAESYARKWSAKADLLRKDAERWRYVSLQGDDTHWLNLLRVDLEDFGGNINAAVDALIDGEAPAMAAKEAGPEHVCSGCGAKGWTGNCLECIPY